ncbi:MAG: tripartite tricarboxylate transporter substrate binding protein [Hyphomicrobiales bacterium]|nr:tripartite tricarboxylate transporter substrate binding protein [Hyphomicrobiales bacterium]
MAQWRGLLAAIALLAGATEAAAYPTRPITIVVPAAPGGVSDSLARAVGQRLSEAWGQQVIIENRGGANHQIGAAQVAKAPRDGHMLMLGAETIFVINPSLYTRLPYEVKDFAPITGLVRANQALLAHPGFAARSVGELIALAKDKPGSISYGTSGVGSAGHVNVALLESLAGIKLLPVHYRGAAPALNDVIAGHIQLTSVAVSSALQPWRNGLVRMLGIGSSKRLPELPDMPTVAEAGVPGYEAVTWFGLFTTAGTPPDVVLKINTEVQRLFSEAAFRKRFVEPSLYEVMTSSPDQFAAFIAAETRKWARVIQDANLRVD